jgi:hypothetical protein
MYKPPAASGSTPSPEPPDPSGREATPQMVLQILATEHWSLLASRNLAWNETVTRTGMFLSTLSFAIVALALVGQATGFGDEFQLFALVVLPVVLFVGVATGLRIDSANYHDLMTTLGMNRIRARYLELAPGHDLERTFVMGTTDDQKGIELTLANVPFRGSLPTVLAATPSLVAVLNAMVVAAIVALLLAQLGIPSTGTVAAGAVAFFAAVGVHGLYQARMLRRFIAGYTPHYPSPDAPAPAEPVSRGPSGDEAR